MAYAELFKSFESDDLTMAQSRFDNFAVLKNERMPAFLDRFVMVANNLKSMIQDSEIMNRFKDCLILSHQSGVHMKNRLEEKEDLLITNW